MFRLPQFRSVLNALLGALLAAAALGASAPRFDFDRAGGRLPKDVKPNMVRLACELDPALETFSGSVQIDLEVRKAVQAIVLNAHRLTAARARLIDAAGREHAVAVKPDGKRQQWRLMTVPAASIAAGRYTVAIDYAGRIENAGEGLFRVDCKLEGTPEPQRMLAYARRVFPGFDEPAFRARFELSVTAPARYAVVSNMPPLEDRVDAGLRRIRFAPTSSMPSCLFALAVGEFDALEDEQDGVKLRILTAKGKREQGACALH